MLRSGFQKFKDCLTFPFRAFAIVEEDRWGLSSHKTDRFDFVGAEVKGYCLDIGCGRHNLFITKTLDGNGVGIDVYQYDGLKPEQIVQDMTHLPFADSSFDTVTFIGNINHIPESIRDAELSEAFRCLRHGGNVVITMGNPVAEIIVHKLVTLYDRYLGTDYDVDNERGMHHEEAYYLTDAEITGRMKKAGLKDIKKKYFYTQWFLNHLFVGWKR